MSKNVISLGPVVLEEEEKSEAVNTSSEVVCDTSVEPTSQSNKTISVLSLLIGVLILTNIGGVGYIYTQKTPPPASLPTQVTPVVQLKEPLIMQVSHHIVLPGGEEPTVATVIDSTKLSGQPFFLHAKNGDKVLLYTKAAVAYLYRPSIDKIITVGSITIQQAAVPQNGSKPQISGPLEVLGAATVSAGVRIEKK